MGGDTGVTCEFFEPVQIFGSRIVRKCEVPRVDLDAAGRLGEKCFPRVLYGLLLRGAQGASILLDLIYIVTACLGFYLYVDATITLRGGDEVAVRIA